MAALPIPDDEKPTPRIELGMHPYQGCVIPLTLYRQARMLLYVQSPILPRNHIQDNYVEKNRSGVFISNNEVTVSFTSTIGIQGFEPWIDAPKAPVLPDYTISRKYVRRESNPHTLRQRDLNPPCIPIPPRTQEKGVGGTAYPQRIITSRFLIELGCELHVCR